MREEIKKQFEMDESLSGSDISSLACKDQWMEDKHGNHKLPSKGQDGKLSGGVGSKSGNLFSNPFLH
ncbi:hypothetical protein Bca52824_002018 [Brassica carinata]|uniref:Uncharacterized protein n=1 Tax=Brassica carinata TaxID=52824 RepID=A0A8X7WMM7_BRACI|nr:hypothetical protein Bca52824_002018 [Brassica carinata]